MREVYPRLFKHCAMGQHPALAAATFFPYPLIFRELAVAISGGQLLANMILELKQESFNLLDVGNGLAHGQTRRR
ncbi:hypothetical protein SRABI106_04748 [Rahnella aquatilis]|nr:hypothetical protein SRABI106_04748 [Rahnella aquatilis]